MVPEGWKLSSLGEVCGGELQTGPFGSQLHAREYIDSGTAVLMPKDLINGKADMLSAAKISASRANSLTKHRLEVGDLLFSRRGDVGRTAMITPSESDSLCGTGCLRARPSSEHHPQFLAYFLQRRQTKLWLEQNAVGQTMLNMNASILSELPLLLPPLPEQQKIARILSTWDTAIETVEKLIENSKAQKKALMQQLLTGKRRLPGFSEIWREVKLKALAKIFVSNVDKKTFTGEKPIRLCNYTDVYYNDYITDSLPFMKATARTHEIEKFKLIPGDVIITKDSETPEDIAVPAVVSETLNEVVCGYHLAIIRPQQELADGLFLSKILSIPSVRHYFFSLANGASRFGLTTDAIANAKLLVPTLPEQRRIGDALWVLDRRIKNQTKQRDALRRQKEALMQQLLTGKRRVKIDPEAVAGDSGGDITRKHERQKAYGERPKREKEK